MFTHVSSSSYTHMYPPPLQEWPIPKKDAEAFLKQLVVSSTVTTVTTVEAGKSGGEEELKSSNGGEEGGGKAGVAGVGGVGGLGGVGGGGLSLRNVVRSNGFITISCVCKL